jgi:uncharacterized membrane protein
MYLVLLLAWLLKTSSNELSVIGPSHRASSVAQWVVNCQIAALPGTIVIGLVAAFYGWLLFIGVRFWAQDIRDQREYGEVHV